LSNEAGRLLAALDLVAAGSGEGRYLRATPGPAQGYRYWATMIKGDYIFGVQPEPKRELSPALIERFKAAQFDIRENKNEAFMNLGPVFEAAIDRARVTMKAIAEVLD